MNADPSVQVRHVPIPVWRSPDGGQYCSRHSDHEAWVAWPCGVAE